MTEKMKDLRESINAAIRSGRATMRPRWHFLLHVALIILGLFLALLLAIYLLLLAVLLLHDSGLLFVPFFGVMGILEFLTSAPWLIFFGALVFLVVLEVLVRNFAFAYRRPLLYSLGGLTIVVILGTATLYIVVPVHILDRVMAQGRSLHTPPAHVHPGEIIAINEDGFILRARNNEDVVVIVFPETRFPAGIDLREGDHIVVMGERSASGTIAAMGVRRMDDGDRPARHNRGWMHPDTSIPMQLVPVP